LSKKKKKEIATFYLTFFPHIVNLHHAIQTFLLRIERYKQYQVIL